VNVSLDEVVTGVDSGAATGLLCAQLVKVNAPIKKIIWAAMVFNN
jgi:hypothetical protein